MHKALMLAFGMTLVAGCPEVPRSVRSTPVPTATPTRTPTIYICGSCADRVAAEIEAGRR
jgi:hypothetical protein